MTADILSSSMLATSRDSLSAAQAERARQTATLNKGGRNEEQVRQAAEDFEAMFLSQMFNHMFSGVKADKMFGGGAGEDTWKSLLVDEYAKATVRKGGVGVADHVMQAMLQAQEAAQ
ncbi:rod-binding protein [Novispirillum sp. DQ9]|uniref:rod-binding protein n=1 Tax=Novispirillum sp. DQ9 TaxID=3398612 RepID=UPI003C7DC015